MAGALDGPPISQDQAAGRLSEVEWRICDQVAGLMCTVEFDRNQKSKTQMKYEDVKMVRMA